MSLGLPSPGHQPTMFGGVGAHVGAAMGLHCENSEVSRCLHLPPLPASAMAAISAADRARPLNSSSSSINPTKKFSTAVVGHVVVELPAPMKAVLQLVSTEPSDGFV